MTTSLRLRDILRAVKKRNRVIGRGGLGMMGYPGDTVCAVGAVVCLVNLTNEDVEWRDDLRGEILHKAHAMEAGFENKNYGRAKEAKKFLGLSRFNRYEKMGQKLRAIALDRA